MRIVVAAFAAVLPSLAMAADSERVSDLPPPSAELLMPRPRSAEPPSMHPGVVLRDGAGAPVSQSGQPASARRTCDGCHDVAWIEAHDYHGEAVRKLGDSIGCFLCHMRQADNQARLATKASVWAETATLAKTGLVVEENGAWRWRRDAFADDGAVPAGKLGLGRPTDRACGFCHGVVDHGNDPLSVALDPAQRMTDLQGIVFSGQRVSDSAMNIAGKENLTRPWDVHAERMVSCANCHFSPNHPAYAWAHQAPEHLQFDARRSAITEYLRRPDHRLARGMSAHAVASGEHPSTIRRCESCHDAGKVHAWLPRAERHFAALLCESCHVPAANAPARQETDATVLTARHQPRVVYRGLGRDGFVTGYRPALLPRKEADGSRKLGPNNVVTSWFWTVAAGGGRKPVASELLERAFFRAGDYKPEVVRGLDRDGDGKLAEGELLLDTEARRNVVRDLLVAEGATAPEIAGRLDVYPVHHGISPGRFATHDCAACHARDSRLTEPLVLADRPPFGAPAIFNGTGAHLSSVDGRLLLVPDADGLHVFGHTQSNLVDGIGIFLVVSALAGGAGHGLLRIRSARRRGRSKEPS